MRKAYSIISLSVFCILILSISTYTGCFGDDSSDPAPSSEKSITAFSFPSVSGSTVTISGTDITAVVPYGTAVTALVATFTLSEGASATVDSVAQVSGTTENDFSSAVTYTITAADGTTQDYTVTIDFQPAVMSTTPYDGENPIDPATDVVIVFSEAMDTSTITTNLSGDSTCSGTIQVSDDSFSTCQEFLTGSPVASNGNKTFTFDTDGLIGSGPWVLKITSGVTDAAGNALEETTVSFTAP